MAITPLKAITPKLWKGSQDLIRKGYFNLSFKINKGVSYIVPSTWLIKNKVPEDLSLKQTHTFITTWAKEYRGMVKNPTSFIKLVDGSWDVEVLNDMMFSFWKLDRIPPTHKRYNEVHATPHTPLVLYRPCSGSLLCSAILYSSAVHIATS